MTQEEKDLLIKDLSARVYYGIICQCNPIEQIENKKDYIVRGIDENGSIIIYDNSKYAINCYKPYLRKISSATEKEKEEIRSIKENICLYGILPGTFSINDEYINKLVDFYNSHHFDYRGLIEKGLALEAPKGMYNIKEK
jgi:hypothetical protein